MKATQTQTTITSSTITSATNAPATFDLSPAAIRLIDRAIKASAGRSGSLAIRADYQAGHGGAIEIGGVAPDDEQLLRHAIAPGPVWSQKRAVLAVRAGGRLVGGRLGRLFEHRAADGWVVRVRVAAERN